MKKMIDKLIDKYYQCKYAYFYKGKSGLWQEILSNIGRGK